MSDARRVRPRGRPVPGSRATILALGLLIALPAAAQEPPAELQLTRLGGTEPAIAFSVPTPAGGTLSLEDVKGKIVLLNFWATWCEPCLEEMPALERLAQAYRDRDLVVVALSADREGAPPVRSFLRRHSLTFPVGLDPTQAVARSYRVWALPTTFVLDRAGARLFVAQGARDWSGPSAFSFFDALLKRSS